MYVNRDHLFIQKEINKKELRNKVDACTVIPLVTLWNWTFF